MTENIGVSDSAPADGTTLPLKLRGYGTSRWQLCNRILTIPEAFDKAARQAVADTSLICCECVRQKMAHCVISPPSITALRKVYSITSSARPSSGNGMLRPRALAVLRLMISSTFVTCCTGSSAGFSPLRMRPT